MPRKWQCRRQWAQSRGSIWLLPRASVLCRWWSTGCEVGELPKLSGCPAWAGQELGGPKGDFRLNQSMMQCFYRNVSFWALHKRFKFISLFCNVASAQQFSLLGLSVHWLTGCSVLFAGFQWFGLRHLKSATECNWFTCWWLHRFWEWLAKGTSLYGLKFRIPGGVLSCSMLPEGQVADLSVPVLSVGEDVMLCLKAKTKKPFVFCYFHLS